MRLSRSWNKKWFGFYISLRFGRSCIGWPSCDGDLIGEDHDQECPMYKKGKL